MCGYEGVEDGAAGCGSRVRGFGGARGFSRWGYPDGLSEPSFEPRAFFFALQNAPGLAALLVATIS